MMMLRSKSTAWTISNETIDPNEMGAPNWGARSLPNRDGSRTLAIEYRGTPPAGALQAASDEAVDAAVEAAQKALQADEAVQRYKRASAQLSEAQAERKRLQEQVKSLETARDAVQASLPDGAAARLQSLEVELAEVRLRLEAQGRVIATLSPIVEKARGPAENAVKVACKAPRLDEVQRLQKQRGEVLAKLAKAAGGLLDDFARVEAALDSVREVTPIYNRTLMAVLGVHRPDVLPMERAG